MARNRNLHEIKNYIKIPLEARTIVDLLQWELTTPFAETLNEILACQECINRFVIRKISVSFVLSGTKCGGNEQLR